ncbi:MaoC family dehydratase [Pseudonocardia endophytica]|uniref:MaoC family dehydratase n=1 Tax=Pseudonocardia endophytica TaxID=401976 RepID=UPI001047177B|nr:MaoC family dehydratase [Pseudonocardia endophytica]
MKRVFTQDDVDAFGRLSGGTGHIHTDPEFAAATRFGRPLVQGLYLLAVVERALDEVTTDWADLRVRFVAPVRVGDAFEVTVVDGDDGTLQVTGSTHETALVGTAIRGT